MPLNTAVRTEARKITERYEGRIPHLYLDTKGKVTVGVGHMIPNKAAMDKVVMYKNNAKNLLVLATVADKHAEYDTIKKLPYSANIAAGAFKKHTKLIMKNTDIDANLDKHINSFYRELKNYYTAGRGYNKPFDAMPPKVQMALFDMIFNLGLTRLKVQYVKFNAALKAEKWGLAAAESKRIDIDEMRNRYVRELLLKAQKRHNKPLGNNNEYQTIKAV